ncbi:MAG: S1 RNA-binding domain-containing protein [Acidobacteria bacterium]|nr:MAG: S1 RNA-binding domain-containing protein [Acidobacteriota bacterium]REK00153.1 MAG: S1 RNA-binding domain-containing protein [Acidobacteriota bacterium]
MSNAVQPPAEGASTEIDAETAPNEPAASADDGGAQSEPMTTETVAAETAETVAAGPEAGAEAESPRTSETLSDGGEVTSENAETDGETDREKAHAAEAELSPRASSSPPADGADGTDGTDGPVPSADEGSTVVDSSDAAPPPKPMSPELARISAALEAKERVAGKVIGWNKGGFHVAVFGVAAFCPKSQMELANPKKAAAYLDRELEFRIIDIKDDGKRVVVSRVPVLREDRSGILQQLRDKAKSGEPVEGTVRSVTDFGGFVSLGGGLEGLVHRSQITRHRFSEPREVLSTGQSVRVVVLKVEKNGERISLSMKALEPDPWQDVEERAKIGDAFQGTVVRRADFGVFVEVFPGVEGLLHESQLPIGRKLSDDDYSEGKQVEGWIREVDAQRNRLSLSLREVAATDPWKGIHDRYSEGQDAEGMVEQIANFGVFVQLEPGLTGLLPASATGVAAGGRLDRMYRPGSSVKIVIDSIDAKRKRISLALPGAKLEGTKADLRDYQNKLKEESGPSLNAMAAAFERLKGSSS